ncbi:MULTISPECIES: hypothetical protein [Bacillaceae]|nr:MULTISPECIES: hypothetical protein [Bacillaceae]EOR25252.1 hypothetical protein A499_05825 [Niallia nealsonii AAU1]MDU1847195.1 hypothetical protein [Niallia nealsonii]
MGLMSIFKGNKKEKDCCNIEIVEVINENTNCCSSEEKKEA